MKKQRQTKIIKQQKANNKTNVGALRLAPRMENPETLDTRHGMKVRKTKTLHRKLKDEQQGPQQIESRM
jgi:hypothetical protein